MCCHTHTLSFGLFFVFLSSFVQMDQLVGEAEDAALEGVNVIGAPMPFDYLRDFASFSNEDALAWFQSADPEDQRIAIVQRAILLAHEVTEAYDPAVNTRQQAAAAFKKKAVDNFASRSPPTFLVQFVHLAFIPGLKKISAFEFGTLKRIYIHDDRRWPFSWKGISPNQAKLRFVMISQFIESMMNSPELAGRSIHVDGCLLNHPDAVWPQDSAVGLEQPPPPPSQQQYQDRGNGTTHSISPFIAPNTARYSFKGQSSVLARVPPPLSHSAPPPGAASRFRPPAPKKARYN
jgi:hypothetical protein